MLIIGIDPGARGALAVLSWQPGQGLQVLDVQDMPCIEVKVGRTLRRRVNPHGVASLLRTWIKAFARPLDDVQLIIEEVGPQPKDGKAAAFAFGGAFYALQGVAAGLNLPYHLVPPSRWKRALKLHRNKDESRALASRLWPQWAGTFLRQCDDGRAESVLLGYWFAAEQLPGINVS